MLVSWAVHLQQITPHLAFLQNKYKTKNSWCLELFTCSKLPHLWPSYKTTLFLSQAGIYETVILAEEEYIYISIVSTFSSDMKSIFV